MTREEYDAKLLILWTMLENDETECDKFTELLTDITMYEREHFKFRKPSAAEIKAFREENLRA